MSMALFIVIVISLETWQNTSNTFPIDPFRNMSEASFLVAIKHV